MPWKLSSLPDASVTLLQAVLGELCTSGSGTSPHRGDRLLVPKNRTQHTTEYQNSAL